MCADIADMAADKELAERVSLLAERQRRQRGQERKSRTYCIDCEEEIPEARRKAVPGVQRCIECQQEKEVSR